MQADAQRLALGEVVAVPEPQPGLSRQDLVIALRHCRKRAFATMALAEQLFGGPEVTFTYATACAEAWVRVAFDHAASKAASSQQPGKSCPFAVIALGKLGAGELNPSSDVDLLVLYATDEPQGWPLRFPPQVFYGRMTQDAVALLSEVTPDGFCLRVDLDLRPEGKAGTLVNSVDALVNYYERFGTALDRMAWTRARPVGGDLGLGQAAILALEPFVWPRSITGGALASLAQVLGRLRATAVPARTTLDLKLHRGGIRDVELTVAAYQLLHGGRFAELRSTATLAVIEALGRLGLMDPGEVGTLDRAYRFLRRLEHLVQYREDVRTHAVEQGHMEGLARLLEVSAEGLASRMRETTWAVAAIADRLFGLAGGGKDLSLLLDESASDLERTTAARNVGFMDPEAAIARIGRLREAPVTLVGQGGFDRAVVAAACKSPDPDLAIAFFCRLAWSRGAGALLDLCRRQPQVLEALARVSGTSPSIASAFQRDLSLALEHAVLGFRGALPRWEELEAEVGRIKSKEFDVLGEALFALRQRNEVGVMLLDLGGADPLDIGRGLAAIADACIRCVLSAVGLDGARLAVLGLGRLGGQELAYRSDLDLVLVYEGDGAALARPVQRALTLLTTRGNAGPGYELDFRLRPSGNQGPLLVHREAFASWYEREANAAERLGVLVCRPVAGDLALPEAAVRRAQAAAMQALGGAGAVDELRSIRSRQYVRGEGYEPKLSPGGMLDMETAARLAAVALGIGQVGTLALLRELSVSGGRFRQDFAALERRYRFLLALESRSHLVLERPVARVPPKGPSAMRLARSMGFDGDEAARAMYAEYLATLADGQRLCERVMAGIEAMLGHP